MMLSSIMYVPFKKKYTLMQRKAEAGRILKRYPTRIPVICERANTADIALIDKHKYLVPAELIMGQLIFVIRRRLKLDAAKAIFLFVNDQVIPPSGASLGELYEEYKSEDGFLYMTYSGENTFGQIIL